MWTLASALRHPDNLKLIVTYGSERSAMLHQLPAAVNVTWHPIGHGVTNSGSELGAHHRSLVTQPAFLAGPRSVRTRHELDMVLRNFFVPALNSWVRATLQTFTHETSHVLPGSPFPLLLY